MRVTIRGFANRRLIFEETIDYATIDLEKMAEKHGELMAPSESHMLEVEFLDAPNPKPRFARFGTDPSGMARPIAIKL